MKNNKINFKNICMLWSVIHNSYVDKIIIHNNYKCDELDNMYDNDDIYVKYMDDDKYLNKMDIIINSENKTNNVSINIDEMNTMSNPFTLLNQFISMVSNAEQKLSDSICILLKHILIDDNVEAIINDDNSQYETEHDLYMFIIKQMFQLILDIEYDEYYDTILSLSCAMISALKDMPTCKALKLLQYNIAGMSTLVNCDELRLRIMALNDICLLIQILPDVNDPNAIKAFECMNAILTMLVPRVSINNIEICKSHYDVISECGMTKTMFQNLLVDRHVKEENDEMISINCSNGMKISTPYPMAN